ncbi:MAG: hypothetical protein AAGE52_38835 [Myxococcota bacterium]
MFIWELNHANWLLVRDLAAAEHLGGVSVSLARRTACDFALMVGELLNQELQSRAIAGVCEEASAFVVELSRHAEHTEHAQTAIATWRHSIERLVAGLRA